MNEKCAVGVTHFQLVRRIEGEKGEEEEEQEEPAAFSQPAVCLHRSRSKISVSPTSSRRPARRTSSSCVPTSRRSEEPASEPQCLEVFPPLSYSAFPLKLAVIATDQTPPPPLAPPTSWRMRCRSEGPVEPLMAVGSRSAKSRPPRVCVFTRGQSDLGGTETTLASRAGWTW